MELSSTLKRVLVPAGYTSGVGSVALDEEDDVDEKIEVQEGESLEDIKAKLKPKNLQFQQKCLILQTHMTTKLLLLE